MGGDGGHVEGGEAVGLIVLLHAVCTARSCSKGCVVVESEGTAVVCELCRFEAAVAEETSPSSIKRSQ